MLLPSRFSTAATKTIAFRCFSIDFSHEKPAPHQLEHITTRVVETVPLMFRHRLDYTFYRKDVFCDDQIFSVQKKGIEQLMSHFGMIGTLGQLCLPHVEMEVLSAVPVIDEGTVRCRWRVKYVSFVRLITNPRLFRFDYRLQNLSWFDGYSVLTVDGNGNVYKVTLQKTQQDKQRGLLASSTEKLTEKLAPNRNFYRKSTTYAPTSSNRRVPYEESEDEDDEQRPSEFEKVEEDQEVEVKEIISMHFNGDDQVEEVSHNDFPDFSNGSSSDIDDESENSESDEVEETEDDKPEEPE
ncbi:unnamed protein product [Caenorhabditis sp. 36 PRJEB53466]|nr:unnamed protein product [Caenorhabditis sp. 36 PRJEB53466]